MEQKQGFRQISDEEIEEILEQHRLWKRSGGGEGKEPEYQEISEEELKEILDQHGRWLDTKGKGGEQANLRLADLKGRDLEKARLEKAKMEGADLREARLYRADLREAKLYFADLQEANLATADLRRAYLSGTDLRKAELIEADLRGARLIRADLRKAKLYFADLQEANLATADLRRAYLSGTDLRKAELIEADLRGARLIRADLRKANLPAAVLREAHLMEADLQGVLLGGADLRGARLGGADLRKVQLEGADLREASLGGAKLRGAGLTGADLRKARLEVADLQGASLVRVDLRGATLVGADLRGDLLGEADLREASLGGANLRGADLRRAKLQGAYLGEAKLAEAVLSHAEFRADPAPAIARGPRPPGEEGPESVGQGAEKPEQGPGPDQPVSRDALNLHARQMAGADVSNAGLPDRVWQGFKDGLANVAEAGKKVDKIFVGLLAGCAYFGLVLALLHPSDKVKLPIINTEIPQDLFFWAGPLGLLLVYLYFQLNLQRLWERLAELPAIFEDGTPLDKKATPWLPVGYARAHFRLLRERGRPPLSRVQTLVIQGLVWWAAPATLVAMWLRYLYGSPAWPVCAAQIAVTMVMVTAALAFLHLARRTLRLEDLHWPRVFPRVRKSARKKILFFLGTHWWRIISVASVGAAMAWYSHLVIP